MFVEDTLSKSTSVFMQCNTEVYLIYTARKRELNECTSSLNLESKEGTPRGICNSKCMKTKTNIRKCQTKFRDQRKSSMGANMV